MNEVDTGKTHAAEDLALALADDDGPSYAPPSPAEKDALLRQFSERHKQRAGFTTSKGRGLPKAKRSMARQSRRVNRGK